MGAVGLFRRTQTIAGVELDKRIVKDYKGRQAAAADQVFQKIGTTLGYALTLEMVGATAEAKSRAKYNVIPDALSDAQLNEVIEESMIEYGWRDAQMMIEIADLRKLRLARMDLARMDLARMDLARMDLAAAYQCCVEEMVIVRQQLIDAQSKY